MNDAKTARSKITLDQVKISRQASRETTCFTALVYFEGKLIGSAENDGHGGATDFTPRAIQRKGSKVIALQIDTDALEQATAYVKENPIEKAYDGAMVSHVDQALEQFEMAADLRRRLKTKCLVHHNGKLLSFKQKLDADPVARDRQLASLQKVIDENYRGGRMLNTMPPDEALIVWLSAA